MQYILQSLVWLNKLILYILTTVLVLVEISLQLHKASNTAQHFSWIEIIVVS